MIKLITTTLLIAILSGCTQQNNKNENQDNPDISLNAGVGVVIGSGDFGQLGPKDSKILTIKITNTGDAALQGPPQIDNANFSIVYQSGCASVLPTKSCTLKISFSASGKAFQVYNANLNLDSAFLALSAEVVDPNPTQTASVSFSIDPVDFGTITDKQVVVKTITVKNTGTTAINQAVSIPAGSGFSLSYDTCSNKSIGPNKTCTLKVNMNGAGLSGALEADLSYGELLTLSGQVVSSSGSSSLGSPDVKLLIDNLASTAYDFGTLSGTQSKQVII